MPQKRTHSENRAVLCGLCYRKAKDMRLIGPNHLVQIHKLVDVSYDISDSKFQTVVCKSCLLSLSAHTRNPDNPERGRILYKPQYSNLTQPPVYSTRNNEVESCPCTVCKMACENLTPGWITTELKEEYWHLLFPDFPYPTPKVSSYILRYIIKFV